MLGLALAGMGTGLLSYFSSRQVISLADAAGMIVQPGERQSHRVATPTGGGLGLVLSMVVSAVCLQFYVSLPLFWWQGMLPGVVLLAIVGWLDDKRPVALLVRLLIQLVVSLWLVGYACLQLPVPLLGWCSGGILAMIWMMNLYNFMDGSNGMAGFQGVFAGAVMAVLFYLGEQPAPALLSMVVAAACAGFLPLNFPQARVFMGDVASVPLGFIFASLAVYGLVTGAFGLVSSILVMSVFIVDTSLTLARRVFRRERWYTAHNQHVYQRLITHGWAHSRVLIAYQVVNVVLVVPAIVLAESYPLYAMVTAGFVLLLLTACWYTINLMLGVLVVGELK